MINELKIELVDKSVKLLTGETDDKLMVLDEIRTLTDQIEILELGADDHYLDMPELFFEVKRLSNMLNELAEELNKRS